MDIKITALDAKVYNFAHKYRVGMGTAREGDMVKKDVLLEAYQITADWFIDELIEVEVYRG